MKNEINKKEAAPGQETASNDSVSRKKHNARRGTKQWHTEKIQSLRSRLCDPAYHVRMPGTLFEAKWRVLLGKGTCYQLLAILMRTCDWKRHEWHGNVFALAAVMGLSERTVRYQLNTLKKLPGFAVYRHSWSITVFLPDRIFPMAEQEDEDE